MHTSSYSDIYIWLDKCIEGVLSKKNIVTIALSGGTSLDDWYAWMIINTSENSSIFSHTQWCLVDERCVPKNSTERNDSHILEIFFRPMIERGIIRPNQWIDLGEMPDSLEYTASVGEIDIALFGVGPDGHIASIFPHHPVIGAQVEGYVSIHDAPKLPRERITLAPCSIQKISHTALFVIGATKQGALEDFLNPNKTVAECPAKLLSPDIIFQQ